MKVNKEYTPGDWSVDAQNDVISEKGKRVCMVSDWNNMSSYDPYPKANARLIAAAPDLVEALIGQTKRMAEVIITDSHNLARSDAKEFAEQNWKEFLTIDALSALIKAGVIQ